jgi:hypothetical protein
VNYLDKIALAIYTKAYPNDTDGPDGNEMSLFRIYAVLGLCLQNTVTNADVHDAWSAWRANTNPAHPSIVPYEHLSSDVQDLDSKYRDAILAVVEENGGML